MGTLQKRASCFSGEKEEMEGEDKRKVTRIFVGGLGGSVTADDLHKTFSSLGTVKGVEVVRTNGRSFAYMDFLPSSDKSLAKLFSTYNRCIWKGGRLKLEKAKEHYLVRLRREWTEDAELASHTRNNHLDANKSADSSAKQKKLPTTPEKMQLQIFFPRLRKVKSLPFSGTGKHKYSFQRVEVPSLPVHFCDCEEHCHPSDIARGKQVSAPETQSGGIDEEELNIMSSVMNKLFEREFAAKAAHTGTGSAMDGVNSNEVIDDVPSGESEPDQETDADNLILNVVTGGRNKLNLMGSQGLQTISADQESRFSKHQASNDMPTRNKLKAQKRNNTVSTSNKKPHLLLADENDDRGLASTRHGKKIISETQLEELEGFTEAQPTNPKSGIHQSTKNLSWAQKSSWRELVGETDNSSFSISHILPDIASTKQELPKSDGLDATNSNDTEQQNFVKHGSLEIHSKDLDGLTEAQPMKPEAGIRQSGRGLSWLHKSSWRELVNETSNSSFSISHILPGIASINQELPKSDGLDAQISTDNKHQNLAKRARSESTGDGSNSLGVGKEGVSKDKVNALGGSNMVHLQKEKKILTGLEGEKSTPDKNLQIVKDDNDVFTEPPEKKSHWAPKNTPMEDAGIGEFCPFMRSAVSEKEWMKTRAALSGSLKKKSIEK